MWRREDKDEGYDSSSATLISVFLGGNAGLVGCIPATLRELRDHDLDELGLPDCAPATVCENGTAVASPADNPALVRDCTALLLAGPLLAGDAMLNWDAETQITAWEGVTIGGDPARVRALDLPSRGLTGHIPWQLGLLPELRVLRLPANQLTGAIPAQLATWGKLQHVALHDNRLDGENPADAGIPERLAIAVAARQPPAGRDPGGTGPPRGIAVVAPERQ